MAQISTIFEPKTAATRSISEKNWNAWNKWKVFEKLLKNPLNKTSPKKSKPFLEGTDSGKRCYLLVCLNWTTKLCQPPMYLKPSGQTQTPCPSFSPQLNSPFNVHAAVMHTQTYYTRVDTTFGCSITLPPEKKHLVAGHSFYAVGVSPNRHDIKSFRRRRPGDSIPWPSDDIFRPWAGVWGSFCA